MAVTTTTAPAVTVTADDVATSDDHVIDVGRRTRDRRTRTAILVAALATIAALATLPADWYSATVTAIGVDGTPTSLSAEIDGFGVWNTSNPTDSWGNAPQVPRNFGILGPTFWSAVMVAGVAAGMKLRRSSVAVVAVGLGWKYGSAALGNLYDAVAGPDAVGDWEIVTHPAPNLYGMAFTVVAAAAALAAVGLWMNWRDDRAAEREALLASGQPLPPNWLERLATTVIAVMGRIVRNALAEDRRDLD